MCPSLLHEMFCGYMFTVCHVQCGNKLILNYTIFIYTIVFQTYHTVSEDRITVEAPI